MMKVNVVMPKMGESISEGTIIKWHKKKGDKIKKDEIIYEIATDKVDTEIPSPADGVLVEIKVFEQETVMVDTVVAIIETEEEVIEQKEMEPVDDHIPSTTQVGGESIDVTMPKMGESIMEGTIIKWHKKVGDKVEKDEIIYEISTDKVDTEVPSPIEGTLTEILYGENETVAVGTVVAKISSRGGIVKSKPVKAEPAKEENKFNVLLKGDKVKTQTFDKRKGVNKFYSPLVLNIAKKENVSFSELEIINGSGIGGRVTKKDILNYISERKSGEKISSTIPLYSIPSDADKGLQPVTRGKDTEIIPMDNVRQRIMEHVVKSRDTSVHVTGVVEVDMTVIYNFIKNNKEGFLQRENIKLTYMPFIAYAAIRALKEYPLLNASIEGNNIVVKKFINLGIAVAVEPNGLLVPNIKNADERNIKGLAKAINEIGEKTRTKKLIPDDIMNGTFSITNYGVFGSLFGTPIINQPEVAILGTGAVYKKPVVMEVDGIETIAIKPMMYLSLSHDHRLVDGMLGGRFLKYIKDMLENFDTSIV
ncbi:MAG: 2-oxoglutarate dehydrogenase, E2 component, dihydrolipoamide succinyltransferase [Ignavibacteria bacterium RBG_13_36_8]|nr:MAG: 2-oxoglutarate dehydrogenase, E2 component, dihydrolipoamide succinyltransferase [Ignavibacteria bacterium RBG_13_36_8]